MVNCRNITNKTIVVTPQEDTLNMIGMVLRNYCLVIDCGRNLEHGNLLHNQLRERFSVPIKYFVLTHCHPDHRGGIKAFKDTTLVTSEETIKLLPKNIREGKIQKIVVPSGGTHILQDDDLSIEIHHVGGHTPGSCFIYSPHEKIIFAGDLLFSGFESPYPGCSRDVNPEKWIKAIESMMKLDVETVVLGHGPELMGYTDLANYLEFYQSIRKLIVEAIAKDIRLDALDAPDTTPQFELLQKKHDLSKPQSTLDWAQIGKSRRKQFLKNLYNFYKKFQ
ncbi:MAG: MBL fold metallo-hydrolase [Candidatus Hodarchaeales archaeon]|jgi:glyoxylase-like metal-dependent hydrolase (beta-lactamase superfamily II)